MKKREINLTKEEVLHQLSNAGTVFMLGDVSELFIEKDLTLSYLKDNGYPDGALDYFKFLNDNTKKERAIRNFKHSHWRAMLKEPFEVIQDYCKANNLLNEFRSQEWYSLAYILRNGVSHDFRFDFSRLQKEIKLPVTWKSIVIAESMDGKFIPANILDNEKIIDLFENMRVFVNKL